MCSDVPGYNVDLFVETTVTSLSGIILGRTNISSELDNGDLFLSGDTRLVRTIDRWLVLSEYADVQCVAIG